MSIFKILVKCPLFSLNYIYFILFFFSRINKEKKWESGQRALKPSNCNGYSLPTFILKVAKSPLFLAKNGQKSFLKFSKTRKTQIKVGKSPFSEPKSGQKIRVYLLLKILKRRYHNQIVPVIQVIKKSKINLPNVYPPLDFLAILVSSYQYL